MTLLLQFSKYSYHNMLSDVVILIFDFFFTQVTTVYNKDLGLNRIKDQVNHLQPASKIWVLIDCTTVKWVRK